MLSGPLIRHLRHGAATPFAWGTADCCTWVCDWVLTARGRDPDEVFRGRYRTAFGAVRHLRRGGGLEALARRCMARAGLTVTAEPKPGDVAVIDSDQGLALAIRTARGWAAKSERGIVCGPFRPLVIWSV